MWRGTAGGGAFFIYFSSTFTFIRFRLMVRIPHDPQGGRSWSFALPGGNALRGVTFWRPKSSEQSPLRSFPRKRENSSSLPCSSSSQKCKHFWEPYTKKDVYRRISPSFGKSQTISLVGRFGGRTQFAPIFPWKEGTARQESVTHAKPAPDYHQSPSVRCWAVSKFQQTQSLSRRRLAEQGKRLRFSQLLR